MASCEWCREAVQFTEAQVSQGGSCWHTHCFNEAAAERAEYLAERDEAEGSTWRPAVAVNVRKPARGVTVELFPISKQVA